MGSDVLIFRRDLQGQFEKDDSDFPASCIYYVPRRGRPGQMIPILAYLRSINVADEAY